MYSTCVYTGIPLLLEDHHHSNNKDNGGMVEARTRTLLGRSTCWPVLLCFGEVGRHRFRILGNRVGCLLHFFSGRVSRVSAITTVGTTVGACRGVCFTCRRRYRCRTIIARVSIARVSSRDCNTYWTDGSSNAKYCTHSTTHDTKRERNRHANEERRKKKHFSTVIKKWGVTNTNNHLPIIAIVRTFSTNAVITD